MSSHSFHIWALIRWWRVTRREKQPVLFTWALVSYSQKQAGRQSCLGAVDREFFAILELWHIPSIRTIINYSQPQQGVPPLDCVCVCARVSVWPQYALIRSLGSLNPAASFSGSALLLCFLGLRFSLLDLRGAGTRYFADDLLGSNLLRLLRLKSFTGDNCGLLFVLLTVKCFHRLDINSYLSVAASV